MHLKKNLIAVLLLLKSVTLFSQTHSNDSIHYLNEIKINSNKLNYFTTGNKIEQIDSSLLADFSGNNLADLLGFKNTVFIKSYGLGALASISFRGTGASHTAVLWNGFNIQSLIYGQLDLSLIPLTFIDDVQLQYGGAGALFGSGAVGGSINLNTVPEFNKGSTLSVNEIIGSFDNRQTAISMKSSNEIFISNTRFFYHTAKNNFSFINTAQASKPLVEQENAALLQYGLLQENHIKLNSTQKINLHLWYQFSDREIPPVMTSASSSASQQDEFYRMAADWNKAGKKADHLFRTAFFYEKLIYKEPASHTISPNYSKSFITEWESKLKISSHQILNLGINNTYSEAGAESYEGIPHQNKIALFTFYKINNHFDTWRGVISFREEYTGTGLSPFIASIGGERVISKKIMVKGNVSKNYRLPTFNDLFWNPGGNPKLKPESGWSEEAGIELTPINLKNKLHANINLTGFNSNINNWIIWLPGSANIWTPGNVKTVWSRGIETAIDIKLVKNSITYIFHGTYNCVLSTNEKTNDDFSSHKQLIYVPLNNGQATVAFLYKGFYLSYGHVYTGSRYTTSDNIQALPAYQLGNFFLAKQFHALKTQGSINLQINNCWNESYQAIEWRAMPLRNYQLGIKINFTDTSITNL